MTRIRHSVLPGLFCPYTLMSFQCYVLRNVSYFIHRQVRLPRFQTRFRRKKKKKENATLFFSDSFQFAGKITSNILQILNVYLINIVLNRSPIYMLRCAVSDDKHLISRGYTLCRLELYHMPHKHSILFNTKPLSYSSVQHSHGVGTLLYSGL